MNLPNIERASGLSSEDRDALEELVDVAGRMEARNTRLDMFYEGDVTPENLGVRDIPDSVLVDIKCDWSRKAVTSVSERVRLDGFTFTGDYEDEGLERISRGSALVNAFNRNVSSELTHGCMFATVNRMGGRAQVRMHTAETAVATWDEAAGRIGSGLVVADVRRTDWSPDKPVPVLANMHLPGKVISLSRTGQSEWSAETGATPLDRPMMEAFCFRPTGVKPLGQSRITRTVQSIHLEVCRTIQNMVICQAFYAFPHYYLMGITDEMFDELKENKWDTAAGSVLLATAGEDGAPTAGQFSSASPQPFIDTIAAYGKLFSGATGVPLNSLGIVQDNPSSAEAIAAQREDICVAAEDCIESNRVSMRNVALMAMAVDGNTGLDGLTPEQLSVEPNFRNAMRPSIAASADAMTKMISVLPWLADSDVALRELGFSDSQVQQLKSDRDRSQSRALVQAAASLPAAQGAAAELERGVPPVTADA